MIIFKNLNPVWNETFIVKLSPKTLMNGITGVLTNESLIDFNSSNTLNDSSTSNQLEFFISRFNLKLVVYDYDRGFLSDDLIGYYVIDLKSLLENL